MINCGKLLDTSCTTIFDLEFKSVRTKAGFYNHPKIPINSASRLSFSVMVNNQRCSSTLYLWLATSVVDFLHYHHLHYHLTPTMEFLYDVWTETNGKRSKHGGKRGRITRTPTASGIIGVTTCPSHPSDGGKEYMPLELLDWGNFRILNALGNDRSGRVFKAILRREIVAFQICNLWQHLEYEDPLNEVEVLSRFERLAGCVFRGSEVLDTADGLFAGTIDGPLKEVENLDDELPRLKQDLYTTGMLPLLWCYPQ